MRWGLLVVAVLLVGCSAKPDPRPLPPTPRIELPGEVQEAQLPPAARVVTEHVQTLLLRAPLPVALDEPNATSEADRAAWRAAEEEFLARFEAFAQRPRDAFGEFPELKPILLDSFLDNASLPAGFVVVRWATVDARDVPCNCSGRFAARVASSIDRQPDVVNWTESVAPNATLDPAAPFGEGTRQSVLLWPPDANATWGAQRDAVTERARELLPEVGLAANATEADSLETGNLTQRDADVLRALPQVRDVVTD